MLHFGEGWMAERLLLLIPLILSLTVHEWAHAMSAWMLGDDTAERQGRLTLNPLEHMDPIGSFLLPLMGIPFGWAKPVPIDPGRFRGGTDAGIVLTALAGPISNLALALTATLAMAVLAVLGPVPPVAAQLLETLVVVNLLLGFFNMLPIPPLDGSRVVDGLCPDRLRPSWDAVAGLGPWLLGAVLVVPLLLGVPIFEPPFRLAQAMLEAAAGVAG